MKNRIASIVFACLCLTTLSASPRTPQEAASIAVDFLRNRPATQQPRRMPAVNELELAYTGTTQDQQAAYYIFNLGNQQGAVIVSANDNTLDILGYTDEGDFHNQEVCPAMQWWLSGLANEIAHTEKIPVHQRKISMQQQEYIYPAVEPLLGDIAFSQHAPYNSMCPVVDGVRCVTGCVATAMAQIMTFWQHPMCPNDSVSYYCERIDRTISENLSSVTFDWENILHNYKNGFNRQQEEAVGVLNYYTGVAAQMEFGVGGSSCTTEKACKALRNYLGYDMYRVYANYNYHQSALPGVTANLSIDQMQFYFDEELNNARPFIVGGDDGKTGHEFLCDGRDENGLYHFNWGWGGSLNGYFAITSISPQEGMNFGVNFEAIMGIKPYLQYWDTTHVTSISGLPDTLHMMMQQTHRLYATVAPEEAEIRGIIWSSSNEAIARINHKGIVESLQPGEATITATSRDGGLTTTCVVSVCERPEEETPTWKAFSTRNHSVVTITDASNATKNLWYYTNKNIVHVEATDTTRQIENYVKVSFWLADTETRHTYAEGEGPVPGIYMMQQPTEGQLAQDVYIWYIESYPFINWTDDIVIGYEDADNLNPLTLSTFGSDKYKNGFISTTNAVRFDGATIVVEEGRGGHFYLRAFQNGECKFSIGEPVLPIVTIDEKEDNSPTLTTYEGRDAELNIERSALSCATYNTLCLPFSLTEDEVNATFGPDCVIKQLTTSRITADELRLYFEDTCAIAAGRPYLIKPETDITLPTMEVTIAKASTEDIETLWTSMRGVYSLTPLNGESQTLIRLDEGEQLTFVQEADTLKGMRAYFLMTEEAMMQAPTHAVLCFDSPDVPTASENNPLNGNTDYKVLRKGQLIIVHDGREYDAQGEVVK